MYVLQGTVWKFHGTRDLYFTYAFYTKTKSHTLLMCFVCFGVLFAYSIILYCPRRETRLVAVRSVIMNHHINKPK